MKSRNLSLLLIVSLRLQAMEQGEPKRRKMAAEQIPVQSATDQRSMLAAINMPGSDGYTPLLRAVLLRDGNTVKEIVEKIMTIKVSPQERLNAIDSPIGLNPLQTVMTMREMPLFYVFVRAIKGLNEEIEQTTYHP